MSAFSFPQPPTQAPQQEGRDTTSRPRDWPSHAFPDPFQVERVILVESSELKGCCKLEQINCDLQGWTDSLQDSLQSHEPINYRLCFFILLVTPLCCLSTRNWKTSLYPKGQFIKRWIQFQQNKDVWLTWGGTIYISQVLFPRIITSERTRI